jgi:hypothetical protein
MLLDKLKRNVSLGVIEALICMESARRYGQAGLALTGEELERLLRRSRNLYASLAVLHDDQEQLRLRALVGTGQGVAYPRTDFPDVLNGAVVVPPDRLVVTGRDDGLRLRFVSAHLPVIAGSPTKRCPAQRFHTPDGACLLNDSLWDLLIDVYRRSGRLASR